MDSRKETDSQGLCLPATGEGSEAPAGERVGGYIWAHSGGSPGPAPQALLAVSTQPGSPSPMPSQALAATEDGTGSSQADGEQVVVAAGGLP